MIDNNIPKEYLALKINYCRQQLNQLPDVKLHVHTVNGLSVKRISIANRRFNLDSKDGKQAYKIWIRREQLERELDLYETIWRCNFKGDLLSECEPHKVVRTLAIDTNKHVVMDKVWFDSLKNDANTKHAKPTDYPFNGIYYRSAAERDIAMFYTEMGIPFKYEPEVYIKGMVMPIYPDFVLYIEELDNCKFHEHFGIKNSVNYLRTTSIKYGNYTNAGLIPELDVLFTHDVEEIPFDIRYLSSKLNTAIYGTMISTKQNEQHSWTAS